ncbi:PAS domain-containing sensor histidine kinase [Desulfopila sp. IMCC35008]|uniref:hybrid sensor histidine kinase/response regulator n=1 Tax=Desulfopila sp. IMCC35008 TaxID=2653858 RepID=UPI0013D32E22|nr:PAS domain-containing sensor histidine kinase [Desulfopila sp. IMCC35008]
MIFMKPIFTSIFGSRETLARTFTILILLCGLVVFSFTTALEFYFGNKAGHEKIQDNLRFIEESYLPPIQSSLYKLDQLQLELLLNGILKLEGIIRCEVLTDNNGPQQYTKATKATDKKERHEYNLSYTHPSGRVYKLGKLIVYLDYAEVKASMKDWLSVRLITMMLALGLLTILVMLTFQRVVARHLTRLSEFTERITFPNIDDRLQLDRTEKQDELQNLVHTFNALLDRLKQGISEQEHARQALLKSEKAYRNLIENANDAVYIAQDGMMKFCNPIAEQITGYTAEELSLLPMVDLIYPDDRSQVADYHRKRLAGEQVPPVYTFRVMRKDSSVFWVQISVVVVEWEGKPATLNFLRDITEQKDIEQQLVQSQKMDSIGRLAGGIAHDLNNLLSPILGYGELLKIGAIGQDKYQDSLDQILGAGIKARNLVGQLLAFSRKQTLEYKLLQLNDVIDGLYKLLCRTIREDIEIILNKQENLPLIKADVGQTEQVLMNLVVNASDAMINGGKIVIETSTTTLDSNYTEGHLDLKPGRYIQLAVSDTGSGMDQETHEHIFEPFFTTKGQSGTGLGLATVYGIVKQHNGHITVYSEPDQGTTFKVFFPVSETDQKSGGLPLTAETDLAGTETILLVEDDKQVRDLTSAMLEHHGYTIFAAHEGEKACEIYSANKESIDMLLTDVIMPGMNGKELYERLQKMTPDLKVLYMSGYTSDIIDHHGILNSGTQFIQKPFSTTALTRKIRSVFST